MVEKIEKLKKVHNRRGRKILPQTRLMTNKMSSTTNCLDSPAIITLKHGFIFSFYLTLCTTKINFNIKCYVTNGFL